MVRGALFTRYFLDDGIRGMDQYGRIAAGDVEQFAAAVRASSSKTRRGSPGRARRRGAGRSGAACSACFIRSRSGAAARSRRHPHLRPTAAELSRRCPRIAQRRAIPVVIARTVLLPSDREAPLHSMVSQKCQLDNTIVAIKQPRRWDEQRVVAAGRVEGRFSSARYRRRQSGRISRGRDSPSPRAAAPSRQNPRTRPSRARPGGKGKLSKAAKRFRLG
jgi:hypothetical protein